jgi:hypothetical protein
MEDDLVFGWFKSSGKRSPARAAPSLEAVWAQREEVVYPGLFGEMSRGIFVLSIEIFTETFDQSSVDPRWLHHGVFEYKPSPTRDTWLYVTSGTSNPWEQEPQETDPEAYSGIGSELVLETTQQADWAVDCLGKLLAYNILLAHGRFGEAGPLEYGARIPLGGPIDGNAASLLRFVVIAEPSTFPSSFRLPSGRVDLLEVVGITEAERDFAKAEGSAALINLLRAHARFPRTDPHRESAA